MTGPPARSVPYPIHTCGIDGVVYDERRGQWHGLPEIDRKVFCPGCGAPMEAEPKDPPVRLFVCYQCGITLDRPRSAWFGLAYQSAGAP